MRIWLAFQLDLPENLVLNLERQFGFEYLFPINRTFRNSLWIQLKNKNICLFTSVFHINVIDHKSFLDYAMIFINFTFGQVGISSRARSVISNLSVNAFPFMAPLSDGLLNMCKATSALSSWMFCMKTAISMAPLTWEAIVKLK